MPSATACHPTLSPLQLSSSWRSAAARSVVSIRSRGPGMMLSQDRASSYVGRPSLKCATVSRLAPPSGGSNQMVAASHPHVYLSVAWSTLAAWSTRRGGRSARMSEDTSLLNPAWGTGATRSHSAPACPKGDRGPPRESWCAAAGCAAPSPRAGRRRTAARGSLARAW